MRVDSSFDYSQEGVLLSEIAQLDRKREPDEVADQLMLAA